MQKPTENSLSIKKTVVLPLRDVSIVRRGERGRAKSRILSEAQFATIRPFLRISEARIEAARLAMVTNSTYEEIRAANGWKSKQAVERIVCKVWATWQKYQESQAVAAKYNQNPDQ